MWDFIGQQTDPVTPDLFQGVSYRGKTTEDVRCPIFDSKNDRGKNIHQWLLAHLDLIFPKGSWAC